MAKKKKKSEKIGIFTYDVFPYLVAHRIGGFNDGGGIDLADCQGFSRSVDSLVAVIAGERGKDAYEYIENMGVEYRKQEKALRIKIQQQLIRDFPELKNIKEIK